MSQHACQLLLLPGLHGTSALFEPFVKWLPRWIEPILVDYPIDPALGYEELLELIKPRLPRDRPWIVLAESFSGPLAIRVVAERPAHLRGVILAQTFVANPVAPIPPWLSRSAAWLGLRLVPDAVRARLILGWHRTPALRETLDRELSRLGRAVIESRFAEVIKVDVRSHLKRCPVPILYLQAKHDRIVWSGNLRQIRAIRRDVQVATLAGPHLLLQCQPERAIIVIENFVRNNVS